MESEHSDIVMTFVVTEGHECINIQVGLLTICDIGRLVQNSATKSAWQARIVAPLGSPRSESREMQIVLSLIKSTLPNKCSTLTNSWTAIL